MPSPLKQVCRCEGKKLLIEAADFFVGLSMELEFDTGRFLNTRMATSQKAQASNSERSEALKKTSATVSMRAPS